MKFAYVFYSSARAWEKSYDSFFENIYSVSPGDIFIHTWDRRNPLASSHWTNHRPLSQSEIEICSEFVDTKKINEIFRPKTMIIDRCPTYDIDFADKNLPEKNKAARGLKRMLNGARKIYMEARQGNYDMYFLLRLDIMWKSKMSLNDIQENKLMCPILQWGQGRRMIYDVYTIGSKEIMDVKTAYCNAIDKYWFDRSDFPQPLYEEMMTDYLDDNKVEFDYMPLKWDFVRPF